jgi:multiple sugar transport system permease protein
MGIGDKMINRSAAGASPSARKILKIIENILFYIVVLFFLGMFMFTFVWMLLTSFKLPKDVTTYPPVWVFTPTLENYQTVITQTPLFQFFINSLIIASFTVAISMLLSLPAAYSIARFKQRRLSLAILIVRMLPGIIFGLPFFVLYKQLGFIDTYWGLIIVHLTLVIPEATWILIAFFEDVPRDLEEAAWMDGASRLGAFFRISVPLCAPGIAVAAILGFIASWNNFIFVLILGGNHTTTLPMAVYNFMVYENIQFGPLAAASALITFPIIVMALFAQRYLVAGLSMGAVKG